MPTTPQDIMDHLNEITFSSSLVKELRTLALLPQLLRQEGAPPAGRAPLFTQLAALRMHSIQDDVALSALGAGSRANTGWPFLMRLHHLGYQATQVWLERNFTHLGRRATLDLVRYLGG